MVNKNIWNTDKTRFCTDYGRAYWVITLDPDKPIFSTNLENWKYIISIKSIGAKRKTILLILRLYDILILENWAKENSLDKDILLAISSARYSNNELAL